MDTREPLRNFLDASGRLTQFPAKRKMKLWALCHLAALLEPGRRYAEAELNDLLDDATCFRDHATLRRELYNNHFLNREKDGSCYWLEAQPPTPQSLGLAP